MKITLLHQLASRSHVMVTRSLRPIVTRQSLIKRTQAPPTIVRRPKILKKHCAIQRKPALIPILTLRNQNELNVSIGNNINAKLSMRKFNYQRFDRACLPYSQNLFTSLKFRPKHYCSIMSEYLTSINQRVKMEFDADGQIVNDVHFYLDTKLDCNSNMVFLDKKVNVVVKYYASVAAMQREIKVYNKVFKNRFIGYMVPLQFPHFADNGVFYGIAVKYVPGLRLSQITPEEMQKYYNSIETQILNISKLLNDNNFFFNTPLKDRQNDYVFDPITNQLNCIKFEQCYNIFDLKYNRIKRRNVTINL
uniref:ORF-5 n=1 Tax=Buzura suppressaria nuclear polyhedrosis virus TaxID=74320 RepID=A0A0N6WHT6_NPVBS|nr:ORF-5 [Buzura suppressaria nucleopolyhedrovirus]